MSNAPRAKRIMIQGTMSSSGKSFLTAALCRIFKQDGLRAAPFKSQNMALNSFITADGLEIGRAQAMQAEAAGIAPAVEMNPILLKPTSRMGSQVIVNGEVYGNLRAMDYYRQKPRFVPVIREAFEKLSARYDVIVLEGAGSPAEINLKENDIVNMGMARIADAPVLLVGDIDRGGVFASLYGTVELLEPEERARVKGLVINKFRGDPKILEPGLRMIEERLHIPVLGVIPMEYLDLDDEDSLSERLTRETAVPGALDLAVIHLPHISNFTDFNALERRDGVSLRYVRRAGALGRPDLVILPGSKNTMEDLQWLRESGMEPALLKLSREEKIPVIGICGGFQMLGERLSDPQGAEGAPGRRMRGLGLLPVETVFADKKTRAQAEGVLSPASRMFAGAGSAADGSGNRPENGPDGGTGKGRAGGAWLTGYEIHMGVTKTEAVPLLALSDGRADGYENADGTVFGCYLHGLFDNEALTGALLSRLAGKKGISLAAARLSAAEYKEQQYDKLADLVRRSLDLEAVYRILAEET